jgi:anti-sigma-K factor RskA
MDVAAYISSGIIELYSMGALSAQEMKEVERMALDYPEVADEIERVQLALNDYSNAHSRNPRPSLRSKIMTAVEGTSPSINGKVITMETSSSSPVMKYLIAASLLLLFISGITIYVLYHKWRKAESEYALLINEKNEMAANFSMVKNNLDRAMADVTIMRSNSKVITLQSTDSSKEYLARVYWNHETRQAFLDVISLPKPPPGKQYQLWALAGGKPVDAGIFNLDTTMQQMKTIVNADAWAVTLEKEGGSAVPTLSQMYLLSKS